MKKIFSFCIVMILSFSIFAVVSASRYNPFDDYFKYESYQLHQPGVVKHVFVVFNENKEQIKSNITIVYRDHSGQIKQAVANDEGRIFVNYDIPGYIKIIKLRVADMEYEVMGKDAFEDFDYEDIAKGDVDFYAVQYNTQSKIAHLYDAD